MESIDTGATDAAKPSSYFLRSKGPPAKPSSEMALAIFPDTTHSAIARGAQSRNQQLASEDIAGRSDGRTVRPSVRLRRKDETPRSSPLKRTRSHDGTDGKEVEVTISRARKDSSPPRKRQHLIEHRVDPTQPSNGRKTRSKTEVPVSKASTPALRLRRLRPSAREGLGSHGGAILCEQESSSSASVLSHLPYVQGASTSPATQNHDAGALNPAINEHFEGSRSVYPGVPTYAEVQSGLDATAFRGVRASTGNLIPPTRGAISQHRNSESSSVVSGDEDNATAEFSALTLQGMSVEAELVASLDGNHAGRPCPTANPNSVSQPISPQHFMSGNRVRKPEGPGSAARTTAEQDLPQSRPAQASLSAFLWQSHLEGPQTQPDDAQLFSRDSSPTSEIIPDKLCPPEIKEPLQNPSSLSDPIRIAMRHNIYDKDRDGASLEKATHTENDAGGIQPLTPERTGSKGRAREEATEEPVNEPSAASTDGDRRSSGSRSMRLEALAREAIAVFQDVKLMVGDLEGRQNNFERYLESYKRPR